MTNLPPYGRRLGLCMALFLFLGISACAEEASPCASLGARISTAINASSVWALRALMTEAEQSLCMEHRTQIQIALSRLLWNALLQEGITAEDPSVPARVAEITGYASVWQAQVLLGDHWKAGRKYRQALETYAVALRTLNNPELTPLKSITKADTDAIYQRYEGTLALAVESDESGAVTTADAFTRLGDATRGSIKSTDETTVEILTPTRRTAPIQFRYREAVPTAQGKQMMKALFKEIRTAKPSSVTLVGHTDARGSESFNLVLSKQRAEAVKAALLQDGFSGEVIALGKGEAELWPRSGFTAGLDDEEYHALCRRVEWRQKP